MKANFAVVKPKALKPSEIMYCEEPLYVISLRADVSYFLASRGKLTSGLTIYSPPKIEIESNSAHVCNTETLNYSHSRGKKWDGDTEFLYWRASKRFKEKGIFTFLRKPEKNTGWLFLSDFLCNYFVTVKLRRPLSPWNLDINNVLDTKVRTGKVQKMSIGETPIQSTRVFRYNNFSFICRRANLHWNCDIKTLIGIRARHEKCCRILKHVFKPYDKS